MRTTADKSAMCAINRHLRFPQEVANAPLRIGIAVMDHYSLWINGESWDTGTYLTVTDKTTGAPWATISQAGAKEVDAAVTAARQVFANKPLTVAQRYEILTKAAALIRSRNKDLALTMAYEAG